MSCTPMLRGSLGVRSFQKTIVQQPRGMGGDDALRGHRHGVVVVAAAAAAVAFLCPFLRRCLSPTLHLTNQFRFLPLPLPFLLTLAL